MVLIAYIAKLACQYTIDIIPIQNYLKWTETADHYAYTSHIVYVICSAKYAHSNGIAGPDKTLCWMWNHISTFTLTHFVGGKNQANLE